MVSDAVRYRPGANGCTDVIAVGTSVIRSNRLSGRVGDTHLERVERIGGDVKVGHLDVLEEVVEGGRVEDDLGEVLVPQALAQHRARVERDVGRVVALHHRD